MKKTADVVIIGGGCMGASTAYHLTRRGVTDCMLIEREPLLGMGSTGRNAGGVRHQFSTEANIRLSIESIRCFENFKEEVGSEIDFYQHGYLFLLSSEDSVRSFSRSADLQRSLGVDVDLLSAKRAKELAPGLNVDGIIGATFCQRDGIADPNGVTIGFAKAAQSRGLEVVRETEVVGIQREHEGTRFRIETDRGSISAGSVVNAAGAYSRRIGEMVNLDIPVSPLRRHIFITEPIASGVPESRIMVIDFETTFYFHREGAGILFGMGDPEEVSSFDLSVKWDFLEKLIPCAVKRLPRLSEASIAHAWAGLYEMTPDAMPIIGEAPDVPGFYTIAGFSGHGFQHSPAAGRILAEMIIDGACKDIDTHPFSLQRFARGANQSEINVI